MSWREGLARQLVNGKKAEALAIALGLPVEFRVVTEGWVSIPILDWCEFGSSSGHEVSSLPRFKEMVEKTAALLGPASEVKGDGHYVFSEGQAPALTATWNLKVGASRFLVKVRVLSPKGCKIDPRTPFVTRSSQVPELHPECQAAIAELEELGAKEQVVEPQF